MYDRTGPKGRGRRASAQPGLFPDFCDRTTSCSVPYVNVQRLGGHTHSSWMNHAPNLSTLQLSDLVGGNLPLDH